jgi:hypothetical protein
VSLSSICIPSSVTIIGERCFYECETLSRVTFEADSRLRRAEEGAFSDCPSLSSICIPACITNVLREYQRITSVDGDSGFAQRKFSCIGILESCKGVPGTVRRRQRRK